MTETPWPTVAAASKKPNGSPVRMCSGSIRKWPRRESGTRMSHERSLRPPERDGPARQGARQRRRVVDLEPELRQPAAVAERVGDPHPVADVAVELADRVAGLEVGQAQADEDVRAADDEDREVEQVEEERPAGRERGDDEEGGDEQELEPADHAFGLARSIRPTAGSYAPGTADAPAGAAQSGRTTLAPVGRMPSIEVVSSSSRTTWPAWTSWMDELVLMIRRWARAGSASALMSSGMT